MSTPSGLAIGRLPAPEVDADEARACYADAILVRIENTRAFLDNPVDFGASLHSRRASPMVRIALVLLVLAVAALAGLSPPPAQAQAASESIPYDPAGCTPPVADGKVRIAVGRTVLALPAEDLLAIGGTADWKRKTLPAPPDPSQPEGCPSNPIWGSYFTMAFRYPTSDPADEDGLATASANVVYLSDDNAPLQAGMERTVRRRCEEAPPGSIKETLPSGFIRCRYRPAIDLPVADWSTSLVAPKDLYTVPGNRPFNVDCLSGELTPSAHGCPVNYRLQPFMSVFYKVDFARTPAEDVIALDRALRRTILEAEVPDYRWSDGTRE